MRDLMGKVGFHVYLEALRKLPARIPKNAVEEPGKDQLPHDPAGVCEKKERQRLLLLFFWL